MIIAYYFRFHVNKLIIFRNYPMRKILLHADFCRRREKAKDSAFHICYLWTFRVLYKNKRMPNYPLHSRQKCYISRTFRIHHIYFSRQFDLYDDNKNNQIEHSSGKVYQWKLKSHSIIDYYESSYRYLIDGGVII